MANPRHTVRVLKTHHRAEVAVFFGMLVLRQDHQGGLAVDSVYRMRSVLFAAGAHSPVYFSKSAVRT